MMIRNSIIFCCSSVSLKQMRYRLLRHMSSYSSSKKIDPRFKNPCAELQQFIEVPLFKKDDITFNPSVQDMKIAQKLFMPDASHQIKFLASVTDTEQFPQHNLPEVTFIGRSNVGKSSLLRCLFIKVPGLVVRTAKNPGQEQTVNFFQVGNSLCLVDMPGYGLRHPEGFLKAVENYLKNRKNLKRTFLLVDGKVGFQKWDEVALDMLEEFKIPYGLIMTKIDKAIPSQRLRNMLYLQQIQQRYTSENCFPQPFMISSEQSLVLKELEMQRIVVLLDIRISDIQKPVPVGYRYPIPDIRSVTGEGITYLQAYIAHITGNLSLDGQ